MYWLEFERDMRFRRGTLDLEYSVNHDNADIQSH